MVSERLVQIMGKISYLLLGALVGRWPLISNTQQTGPRADMCPILAVLAVGCSEFGIRDGCEAALAVTSAIPREGG
jgi:hypothetical protein